MDVGCSSSLETYSIIENANYSFGELPVNILEEKSEEEFLEIREAFEGHNLRPLVWSGLSESTIDVAEFDPEGGYIKDQLIDLFFKIDMLQGEYVVLKHKPDLLKESSEEYISCLSEIADLAGSFGLEIILLISGENIDGLNKNIDKIKLLDLVHPFLHFGIDLSNIEYEEFFETLEMDNVLYYTIPADEENFKDNLAYMVNKFAESDILLSVKSNLDKMADAVMSNKFTP